MNPFIACNIISVDTCTFYFSVQSEIMQNSDLFNSVLEEQTIGQANQDNVS